VVVPVALEQVALFPAAVATDPVTTLTLETAEDE
jgi:hypothetical protein